MGDSLRSRGIQILLLVLVLGSMCVHYGATADHTQYPPPEELREDYEQHVGERAYYWLTVTEVHDDEIVAGTGDGSLQFRIPVRRVEVERGDTIQVYGTLQPDWTIEPARIVVSPKQGRAVMFGISVLALILTLGMFGSAWRLDYEGWVFEPRPEERDA